MVRPVCSGIVLGTARIFVYRPFRSWGMNRTRALSFAFAALTGLISGLPLTIHADDTEIYVGSRAFTEAVRPNVLLLLDTSGSMASFDGESLDRLDRVKVALNAILDEVNDMNIGLARFHTPGGPILFPVSYVDADVQDVELGLIPEINQRLVGSENDAEQLAAGGATVLDSTQLEMTTTSAFGSEVSTVATVSASSDDASQTTAASAVDTSSTTMDCCVARNGLRFQNVPIPPGSVVTRAILEFKSSSDSSGATNITFSGHQIGNSPAFGAAADIFSRTPTPLALNVDWDAPEWIADSPVFSPNLRQIVQSIVDDPGWAANNSLSLFMAGTGARSAKTFDGGGLAAAANLYLDWVEPPIASGDQIVGLRFTDVRIPQGQGIQSAVLEFMPSEDAVDPVNLVIQGEAVDDSAAFTTTVNDISSRTLTTSNVAWNPPAGDWKEGVAQTSTDLTAVVQEIVNRSGWCGGNAMSFVIRDLGAMGPRSATSFDGDPGRAPILRIDYDTTRPPGPGQGCTIVEVSARPALDDDDVNQNVSDESLDTNRPIIQMDSTKVNGLRYQNLEVPPGVTIVDARLVFTATDPGAIPVNPTGDPVTISFSADATDTAGPFVSGAGTDVLSRTPVVASVSWSPSVWTTVGSEQISPDLSPIIDAVVNGGFGWEEGNDLALLVETTGSGSRIAVSRDDSSSDAPQLRIIMRVNIGDFPGIPVTTVRQRLKQIVDELDHDGTTPLVDVLYEAASYYRGDPVTWGLNRGTGSTAVKRSTRVSHPASYTGGTVVRAAGCTDSNLNASACVSEHITGGPDYISPIDTECQSNFIVMLTDGIANRNSSRSLIESLTGSGSCSSTLPPPPDGSGGSVSSSERCGLELTSFLADSDNDQNPDVPGQNTVTTYTIGLNISNEWLEQIAKVGGGGFYEAGSTAELRETFNKIASDILERTASFATPSLSVNSFNRLFHLDEVYFSLFEPRPKIAWDGNIKKYRLCTDPDACGDGNILDADGDPALGADARIHADAQSFWLDPESSHRPDGANVLHGGAGNALFSTLPRHTERRVLTYTSATPPPRITGAGLDTQHVVKDADGNGILDGLSTGSDDADLQTTKDLLGWPGDPVATLTAPERAALVSELHAHIQWIRGQDVDDEDADGDTSEDRYSFSDPLHSSPVAFTIGGDTENPVVKVVVGTNDGGLRLINGHNGVEEFIFYPQSTLRRLTEVRRNPAGRKHYGIDGTATIWLNDINNNGLIERDLGDFARVFIGQRRGGNEIYSLDITPRSGADLEDQDAIDSINPVYVWRIRGSSAEYPRLGQTWSRPKLATINIANTPDPGDIGPKTALFFAGGYDDSQDSGFGAGGVGNAIYIADPFTGDRWLSVSNSDPGGPLNRVVVDDDPLYSIHEQPKMAFPIPSDLALLDSNADGNVDRILVGDTGGQLWRVDLRAADPSDASTGRIVAVVGRLGLVSSDETLADRRKFFEPPDVIQVRGGVGFSSVANYDLVTIVSGNRANPLGLTVQDRFFAFRDTVIGQMADDGLSFDVDGDGVPDGTPPGIANDGNADSFPTLKGPLDSPFEPGDLFDVTDTVVFEGADLTGLQNANGYYIDLTGVGEKGLSSPITLEGTVNFTTYLPEPPSSSAPCKLVEGNGFLYSINVLNGTAVMNFDGSSDLDPLSVADRRLTLGAGIPSSAIPIFNPDGIPLLIGGSGGATIVDLGIKLPKKRTYWFEEAGR